MLGNATYDGRTHDMSFVYDPSDRSDDDYIIWTMNGHVDIGRARALIAQYDQRMEIESQYATIKQHFLPKTSTMEYGKRFLYFLIGVVMYNVWRMANFILRDAVSVHLGEHPPITLQVKSSSWSRSACSILAGDAEIFLVVRLSGER